MVHADDVAPFVAAYDKAVAALYPNGPASDDLLLTIAITQGSMNYLAMPAVRARAWSNPGQSPTTRAAANILSRR
jgi:hypothetical protein